MAWKAPLLTSLKGTDAVTLQRIFQSLQTYLDGLAASVGGGGGPDGTDLTYSPSLDHATVAGAATHDDDVVTFTVKFTFTGATSANPVLFAVPDDNVGPTAYPAHAGTMSVFTGILRDDSADTDFEVLGLLSDADNNIHMWTSSASVLGSALVQVTPTFPFTIAVDDTLSLSGSYKATV